MPVAACQHCGRPCRRRDARCAQCAFDRQEPPFAGQGRPPRQRACPDCGRAKTLAAWCAAWGICRQAVHKARHGRAYACDGCGALRTLAEWHAAWAAQETTKGAVTA